MKYVICIDNSEYLGSFELGGLYQVLDDQHAESHGLLRVIDESGEGYCYPKAMFKEASKQ